MHTVMLDYYWVATCTHNIYYDMPVVWVGTQTWEG